MKALSLFFMAIIFTFSSNSFAQSLKELISKKDHKKLAIELMVKSDVKIDGEEPLFYAAKYSTDPLTISLILASNSEAARIKNKEGNTPLHEAVIIGSKRPESVRLILEANPDATKVKNNDGNIPLHNLVRFETSTEIVKLVLEANPEAAKAKNDDGETPLLLAIERNDDPDVVKLILRANPEAVVTRKLPGSGSTPLHNAMIF